MCRIAGLVDKSAPIQSVEAIVQKMCDLQQHGGPDDAGTFSAEHLVLGNRRLALLDLTSQGHQPMHYGDRYHITYNGELYNFLLLKEELMALGHVFHNHTDTEVVLAVFAQWNTQGFAKLKGMFAFALWDDLDKCLYLVRDPGGIKPLYYARREGFLAFGSEIRSFSAVPGLAQRNENWPVYLMAYGHLPEPVTTLRDVKPLHKGCFLKYCISDESYTIQSFSHYSYSTAPSIKPGEAEKVIRESIENAVKRHLLSDAPLGVFLSGGLDSGIMAVTASKFKQQRLNTLSIYFEEPEYSEKKYQDLLIERLQCENYQHLLKKEEFEHSLPTILQDMDMPSCDGINTWFISKSARQQGLKAVLSGVGGDELYGGYPSFGRIGKALMIQELPDLFIGSGRKSSSKRLNRMAYLQLEGIKGLYLFLRGHYSPYEIAKQLGGYESEVWKILEEQPVLYDIAHMEKRSQASWMEFNLYMQNQLLRDSDVMSMIHGVEIRVPFLDDESIRLALDLPVNEKFRGPLAKQFLIDVFKDELPQEIWNRPKMGFSFPFSKWLAGSSYVKQVMESGTTSSRRNYERFLKGKMHWSHLMSLVILNNRKAL